MDTKNYKPESQFVNYLVCGLACASLIFSIAGYIHWHNQVSRLYSVENTRKTDVKVNNYSPSDLEIRCVNEASQYLVSKEK